ncbi:MAG: N-acetyltransferase [Phycisphaerales bacterium]|nr:N-acetyltransferase [Phycisphaerales bacterium]
MIRPATVHDVPRIAQIINSHAELGKMLFKSYAQLYANLRDFAIFQSTEPEGRSEIHGCVALTIIWADLAEIRSLAVDEQHRGGGIGSQLVQWTVQEARRLQIRRLMALTYEQRFFEKLGFQVVPKETLPLKVWSDCINCPKNQSCDEIAVVRTLDDVPVIQAPKAIPTPSGVAIPVLDWADDD